MIEKCIFDNKIDIILDAHTVNPGPLATWGGNFKSNATDEKNSKKTR